MIRVLIVVASYYLAILLLKHYTQPIREDGPKHHHKKGNTPTMGGLVLVMGALIQLGLQGRLMHPISQILLGFGILGLYDDMGKLCSQNNYGGATPRCKFILQWVLALWVLSTLELDSQISLLGYTVDLGAIGYWFFAGFVLVATSNAYNLTDGLDGLAATQGLILLFGFGVVAASRGNQGLMEIVTVLWIMLFGFYLVNRHPAKLFMGDVGSLPLGAVLGLLAILLKIEIAFSIAAFVLVWETLSVIIQVISYKLGYGRVFKMAPYHHHLELLGWKEVSIVRVACLVTWCMLYLGSYAV